MIGACSPLISDFWRIRGSDHPESRLERCPGQKREFDQLWTNGKKGNERAPSGHNIGVAVAGKGGGQEGLASPSRQLIAKVPCSLMILDLQRSGN